MFAEAEEAAVFILGFGAWVAIAQGMAEGITPVEASLVVSGHAFVDHRCATRQDGESD